MHGTSLIGKIAGLALAGLVVSTGLGWPDRADAAGRIVAVVEDQIISSSDLDARVTLALVSSGLANTAENQERMRPQVLRLYIDETLQRREAERAGIKVSGEEVQQTLEAISKRNNFTLAQMDSFLQERGASILVLKRQIENQLLWMRLVNRKLRPRVRIGPDQVDQALREIEQAQGQPQLLVAEITLPVYPGTDEAQVRQDADQLVQTIRNGAPFPAVARQFSSSASAQGGGDLGWIRPSMLPEEVRDSVSTLAIGSLDGPVRTAAGWQIFMLRARKAPGPDGAVESPPPPPPPLPARPAKPPTKVRLAQLLIPFPEGMAEPDRQKAIKQAAAMPQRIGSCNALRREAAKYGDDMGGDLGWLDTKDLPPILQQIVTELPNGRLSPPLTGSAGIQMIMVCERVGGAPARAAEPARPQQAAPPPPPLPSMDRDAVQQRLELEQLDRLAARYLRDLRRDAFIDLRGA